MCEEAKKWEDKVRGEERKLTMEQTENAFAQLSEGMIRSGCSAEDFARVMSDKAFRRKMMRKYGIS